TALLAVVRVLPILKMNTPLPLNVSAPVSCADDENLYTPGTRFLPPRFLPVRSDVVGALAASVYAVFRSFLRAGATASCTCLTPATTPGGNPVTAEPAWSPRFPVTTVGPVFVIVEPANTVKLSAVPRRGLVAARAAPGQAPAITAAKTTDGKRIGRRFNIG